MHCFSFLHYSTVFTFYSTDVLFFVSGTKKSKKDFRALLTLNITFSGGKYSAVWKAKTSQNQKLKDQIFFSLQEFKLYYLFLPIHRINLFYLFFSNYSSYPIAIIFPTHFRFSDMRDGKQNWLIKNKVVRDADFNFFCSNNKIFCIKWMTHWYVFWNTRFLTMSHGRTCALLHLVQKFIKIQGWLRLTFFICLHNQLSSFNSVIRTDVGITWFIK